MVTEPRLLGERYELAEMLGYGGMAEVHRARDTRLGRDVAVKTLRADLARDPTFHARFRREAQSAASLNHPAIVAVYDTGEENMAAGDVPYIVMEYVEGRTLRDLLNVERRLPWRRALGITARVCQALDYSHRQGIVHRDIKPANVMLTDVGSDGGETSESADVKVMDFGIARAVTASSATMTQTAAVLGTAQYLSPEQARGEPVDARSDVYSTGCVLYELLTGSPPFIGDSPVSVAYQHVREDPVPPSQLVGDLPPPVDAIVLKAMAKNPSNRYQSAAEMRADCERAIAGAPVAATPLLDAQTTAFGAVPEASTVLLRQPPPERRRWPAFLLLAIACLAVLAGAALLTRGLVGNGQRVAVPDLRNDTLAKARQELDNQGLKLGGPTTRSSNATKGRVISQDPPAMASVVKGSTVNVVVSAGPGQVAVPPLEGLSQEAATRKLKDAGLSLGDVTPKASSEKAGTVLTSNPPVGSNVAVGSKVDLDVASGSSDVPDVVGKDEAAARQILRDAGFQVDTQTVPDRRPVGTVIGQDPNAGSSLRTGRTVTITVATAVPTESPSPAPSASPSTSSPAPTGSPTPTATGTPTATATATPTKKP